MSETILTSYAFAARALVPSAPFLLAFATSIAVLVFLSGAALAPVIWFAAMICASVAAFVIGNVYSAKLYGLAFRTGPVFPARDDVINLGISNAAVYLLFFLVSFFIGFFLVMLPGIFAAQMGGLDRETAQADPEAVRLAVEGEMAGPAGIIVGLATAAGAAVLLYIAMRLVLFGVATFARGEIRVLSTWEWTIGSAREIALVAAVVYAPTFLIFAAVMFWAHSAFGNGQFGQAMAWFVSVIAAAPFLAAGHGMAAKVYLMVAPNLVDAPRAPRAVA